MPVVVILQKLG